jgi:hypothetical protein
LHGAGYFLNPYFYYEEIDMDGSFMSDFVEVIWRFYLDDHEIVEEIGQQLSMYQMKLEYLVRSFCWKEQKKLLIEVKFSF